MGADSASEPETAISCSIWLTTARAAVFVAFSRRVFEMSGRWRLPFVGLGMKIVFKPQAISRPGRGKIGSAGEPTGRKLSPGFEVPVAVPGKPNIGTAKVRELLKSTLHLAPPKFGDDAVNVGFGGGVAERLVPGEYKEMEPLPVLNVPWYGTVPFGGVTWSNPLGRMLSVPVARAASVGLVLTLAEAIASAFVVVPG